MPYEEITLKLDRSESLETIRRWEDTLHMIGCGGIQDKNKPDSFYGEISLFMKSNIAHLDKWNVNSFGYRKTQWDSSHFNFDYYAIALVHSGQVLVEQGGRSTIFQAGEIYLRSCNDPGVVIADQLDVSSLVISGDAIRGMLASPDDLTALRLNCASPWGLALAASMKALTPKTLQNTSVPVRAIVEQMTTLLSLSLEDAQPLPSSYKTALLRRIKENMREHLADSDYGPASLAEDMGVSKRTIHATFAESGTSFGHQLTLMRLQKARDYLDCSAFNMKSIKEISTLVGYNSPSLFILRFRQMFGLPPAEYRQVRHSR